MPKLKVLVSAGGLIMLAAPALAAVTVINETDKSHTVTFDRGHDEVKHEVEPNGKVSETCPEQCGVRFSGHDAVATDGDTYAIVEGSTRPVKRD